MNEDLSQMIGKIMANPEFGNLVNQVKSSGLVEKAQSAEIPSAEDMADKIPALLGMLGQSGAPTSNPDTAKIEKALGALRKMDNRNCEKLLCALKPYLNSQRGEVIDKAMSMMKITDLLGVIQQTDSKEQK